jgi:hypothetical protein
VSKRKRARKQRAVATTAARPAVVEAPVRRAAPPKPAAPRPRPAAAPAAGPAPLDRTVVAAAGAVGLIALVVYALTVERSVPTGDSGELIAAAYVLGVAHPPGYPLFTLLGHLATMLPGGSPALRVNLLSALFDAAAVSVVFLTVYRLVAPATGRRRLAFVAAAVGSLLLAFSSLFWAYSVVAEVFALNNLLAALLLLIGIEWSRRPERVRLLWLFALLFGLALCNQQTIVLLVPAFAVLAWRGWTRLPRLGGRSRLRPRALRIAAGAFLVGLLPYLYLPIAASGNPALNWGDPTTVHRFVTQVTRGNYGSTSLAVGGKPGSAAENVGLMFSSLARGFLFVGLALAVAGLWWSWRRRRAEGIALLVAFAVAGPAFMLYTRTAFPDQLTKGVVARFYILPSIPLAILVGLGAWWLLEAADRLRRPALRPGLAVAVVAGALLVVPAAAAAAHYSAEDQSGNRVAIDYAHDLLDPLPPHALLLMRGDEDLTSVLYAQNVAHVRPDVVALGTELLKLPTYVASERRAHPDVAIPFAFYDGGVSTSLNDLVRANIAKRPIFYVGAQEEKRFGKPFDTLNEGLTHRLVPRLAAPDPNAYLARNADRYARMHFPARRYPAESWETVIAGDYAYAALDLGYAIQLDGGGANVPLAERMYRTAIRLLPTLDVAYKDLGLLLHDNGGDPKEIVSVWDTYLRLAPNDPQAPAIRSVLATLKAKTG